RRAPACPRSGLPGGPASRGSARRPRHAIARAGRLECWRDAEYAIRRTQNAERVSELFARLSAALEQSAADVLDARAIDAKVTAAYARRRAHLHQLAVRLEVELHI